MVVPESSPPLRRLPASFCVGVLLAGNLVAQTPVRLAQETPLLREPGGVFSWTYAVPGNPSVQWPVWGGLSRG